MLASILASNFVSPSPPKYDNSEKSDKSLFNDYLNKTMTILLKPINTTGNNSRVSGKLEKIEDEFLLIKKEEYLINAPYQSNKNVQYLIIPKSSIYLIEI